MDSNIQFSIPIDLEFDWHLTNRCNFDCHYCFPAIKRKKNRLPKQEFSNKEIIKAFTTLNLSCNISMSGGEPFLYNNFIAFCEALTERHCIGLNTNLSTANVELFAETIKPEKVSYIWAAVHLDERLKLDKGIEKFASRYLLLCEKGFKVNAIYVLHPTKIDIFEKELLFIKNFGISSLQVKVFKGVFKGKTYPEAFPDKVRDKILRNSGGYLNNAFYLDGETNFKGVLCKAGMTFFKLFEDGKVERCASDNEDYGNLFKGTFKRDLYPLPCKRQKVKALSQCKRFII